MKRKKLLSMFLTAAVALTILAPTTAMAEETTTWKAPTSAMEVDNDIAKVGIHAAASTTAFFLGGNVVAERASDYSSITGAATAEAKYQAAMKFTRLGAFGSSSNISPDPYLWNYFYNLTVDAGHAAGEKAKDEVYISTGASSPMSSDTAVIDSLGTSYTLDRRPDILMDKAGGYADLIAQLPENKDDDPKNNYNPISMDYKANNFADLVNDMYNLSDAIKKSGKKGRYGDTDAIAQNYEAYMKGLQYYVIKKINAGEVEKKNVAVITDAVDTNDDGKDDSYICVSNEIIIGTSTDRPSEGIMYTANNILDVYDGDLVETEVPEYGRNGQPTGKKILGTVATAEQVASMDAIIYGGHNTKKAAGLTEELVAAGVAEDDVPPIYDTDPLDVFTIRANSVEGFICVALFNGWLYPEVLNPVDATMYVYENFWHVKESELKTFAQANFADATVPDGVTTDGSTYSEEAIADMIREGLEYGAHVADQYEGTTLEISDRLTDYDLEGIEVGHNFVNHVCTVCGEEDEQAVITFGEDIKIYPSDIANVAEKKTLVKNGKSGATEITADFAPAATVLKNAGVDVEAPECGFNFISGSDGFTATVSTDDLSEMYIYQTEDGSYMSARDGSAGRYWVGGLANITATDEHNWDDGVVTKEATCTEAGVKTYTCKVCGETKTEEIAATGHTWDKGVVTKEATFTEEGVMTYTCTACGEERTETIAKLTAKEFKDVPNSGDTAQFYNEINWMAAEGYSTGWSDGTFRPWNTINRAAVVTFLWRMDGSKEPSKMATFSDMTDNADFNKAISWAQEKGITTGYSDNTFRPWEPCNRAAIVTFIWRAEGKPTGFTSKFSDKTGNSDFDTAIAWASETGITNGFKDGTFKPWDTCKRAAVAAFLYRIK